jgi:hypothetical protein
MTASKTLVTLFVGVGVALSSVILAADNTVATAVAQAMEMARAISSLDAERVIALSDLDTFRAFGGNLDDLRIEYSKMMTELRTNHAKYTKFELGTPSSLITEGAKIYVIIPYGSRMNAGGQLLCQQAFFVGMSSDGGKMWKFIDGIGVTDQIIGKIIPNYDRGPLPPRAETSGAQCSVPP